MNRNPLRQHLVPANAFRSWTCLVTRRKSALEDALVAICNEVWNDARINRCLLVEKVYRWLAEAIAPAQVAHILCQKVRPMRKKVRYRPFKISGSFASSTEFVKRVFGFLGRYIRILSAKSTSESPRHPRCH